MKERINLALDKHVLKKARGFAARRGTSASDLLADQRGKIIAEETQYKEARTKALAQLSAPFSLGGAKAPNREALQSRGFLSILKVIHGLRE